MSAYKDALALLYPQFVLAGSLVGTLSFGLARGRDAGSSARWLAVAGCLAGLALCASGGAGLASSELIRLDGTARLWQALFFLGALPLLLVMRSESELSPALVLAALLGMSVLASANQLFLLFLGLELMSLPTYLLIYRLGRGRLGLEAAIKYFFMGSMAAALFLLGLSIHYAAGGSLALSFASSSSRASELGLALMGSAALFKIGTFPMHFWLPDAYDAAPPELSGFMSSAVKAAGFLLLIRVLELGGQTLFAAWLPMLSAATMTVGNLLALRQTRVSRLLAYSSVAHAGYLLAGVWAATRLGGGAQALSAVYLYLAAYVFMSSGAFLFLRLAGVSELRQLRGLGRSRPWLTGLWAVLLLSLAGVPPSAGFLAKLFVVLDLLRADGAWLAVALALNSVVGLGYYFRLVRSCFLEEPEEGPAPTAPSAGGMLLLAGLTAVAVLAGLWPGVRVLVEPLLGQGI